MIDCGRFKKIDKIFERRGKAVVNESLIPFKILQNCCEHTASWRSTQKVKKIIICDVPVKVMNSINDGPGIQLIYDKDDNRIVLFEEAMLAISMSRGSKRWRVSLNLVAGGEFFVRRINCILLKQGPIFLKNTFYRYGRSQVAASVNIGARL